MNFLKKLGIALIVIVTFLLILALVISKDFNYEKSISIDRSVSEVWLQVNSLAAIDQWSPWNDYDPSMKKTITGIDGTVGATQSWESNVKEVGNGSQTITKIDAPFLIETHLKFLTPYESDSQAYIKLIDEGTSTKVTWGFKSKIPYPFNLMKLFINMDKMMDKDWNNGLSKLKNNCENEY